MFWYELRRILNLIRNDKGHYKVLSRRLFDCHTHVIFAVVFGKHEDDKDDDDDEEGNNDNDNFIIIITIIITSTTATAAATITSTTIAIIITNIFIMFITITAADITLFCYEYPQFMPRYLYGSIGNANQPAITKCFLF